MIPLRSFTAFVLALFILATPSIAAKKNPWKVNLPFKKAVIQYKVTGNENGSETLYIRKYGKETVRVRKSAGKVLFISTETNTIEITTPNTIINIDMKKKEGQKMTNPQKFMIEEYEKLTAKEKATVHKNAKKMGTRGMGMLRQMGGTFKPKAGEHLGYKCDIVAFMGTTVYQMSDTPIPLKVNSSMMGIKMNSVATSVKKKSPPSNVFAVPGGVDVRFDKEAEKMNRNMAKSMMDMLKDPDAGKKMQKAEQQGEARRDAESGEQEEKKSTGQDMMEKGLGAIKGLF